MKIFFLALCLVLLCLSQGSLLLSQSSSALEQPAGTANLEAKAAFNFSYLDKRLREIKVIGNVNLKAEQIVTFFPLKLGVALDPVVIRRGVRELMRRRVVETVRVEGVIEGDELVLELIVKEFPFIGEVLFVGNDEISSLALLENLGVSSKDKYDEVEVNRARFSILKKYQEDGFLDAAVSVSTAPAKQKGAVDLIFNITEGLKLVVKKIEFKGNEKIPTKELLKAMETKEKGFLKSGLFNITQFEQDKQRIVYYYRTKGYVKAKLLRYRFAYEWKNPNKKVVRYVSLFFEVFEGEQYFFGTTTIRGNTIFSTRELSQNFNRSPGTVFNQKEHDENQREIYFRYQENGYIFARITPIETINPDRTIDYIFDIYEGEKAHIENIIVRGLVKTKPKVVRRELLLREGELFNVVKLQNSLLKLQRLNFFEKIIPDYRSGSVEGLMNLVFTIKEQRTAKVSGGITYGINSGFSLIGSFEEPNFLGLGQLFSISANFGFLKKDLKVSFVEPWFLDHPISLGASVTLGRYYISYNINNNLTAADGTRRTIKMPGNGSRDLVNRSASSLYYTRDNLAFTLSSGQRFLIWYELSQALTVSYSREHLQSSPTFPERYSQLAIYEANKDLFSTPPPFNKVVLNYIFSWGLSRDTRNSLINPTQGSLVEFKNWLYFGSYWLSSWRLRTEFVRPIYFKRPSLNKFNWKLILVYRAELQTLGRSVRNDFIYPTKEFYTFSQTELRGWSYSDLYDFRRQRLGDESLIDNRAFAQATFRQTFEARLPLGTDLFQVLGLFDLGNLSVNKISFDPNSLKFIYDFENYLYDTGFGFRLNIPQLPIRFYFSWRFIFDQIERKFRLFNSKEIFNLPGTAAPTFTLDFQGLF